MQPPAELVGVADLAGLSREDKKRRLECIVGGVSIAENPAADAQDHRSVHLHQGLEGGVVVIRAKAAQEALIRHPARSQSLLTGASIRPAGFDLVALVIRRCSLTRDGIKLSGIF
jgi:hypothetical protein